MQVTVLRDGRTQEISTFDLLVGDVLLVDTGDILAADGMLAQGNDLRSQPGPVHCTDFNRTSNLYVLPHPAARSSPISTSLFVVAKSLGL